MKKIYLPKKSDFKSFNQSTSLISATRLFITIIIHVFKTTEVNLSCLFMDDITIDKLFC